MDRIPKKFEHGFAYGKDSGFIVDQKDRFAASEHIQFRRLLFRDFFP